MNVLVIGGGGFIGGWAATHFAGRGHRVVAYDNFSRAALLGKRPSSVPSNRALLAETRNIDIVEGDITDRDLLFEHCDHADVVIHAAGQTAVTASLVDPVADFGANAQGTFVLFDVLRKMESSKTVIYCSTNKVYGDQVNALPIEERDTRYVLGRPYENGVPETLPIDGSGHSPYGCSKLAGDIYMQEAAHGYNHKVAVFRMSCVYGPHQSGVEDQGWISWFVNAVKTGSELTIYGDGKQLRDVLYITDLMNLYDRFLESNQPHLVANVGGGPPNTLSLIELLAELERILGIRARPRFGEWRPNDQKVYVSDINKCAEVLGWRPRTSPVDGISRFV